MKKDRIDGDYQEFGKTPFGTGIRAPEGSPPECPTEGLRLWSTSAIHRGPTNQSVCMITCARPTTHLIVRKPWNVTESLMTSESIS